MFGFAVRRAVPWPGLWLGVLAIAAPAVLHASTWRVPIPVATVRAALALAADGDTIQIVGNGGSTYSEFVNVDKDVTIQGGWRADFQVRDPEIFVSVLRAANDLSERPLIRVDGPRRLVLDGIHLVGGQIGVEAEDGADLTIRRCVIRDQSNGVESGPNANKAGGALRVVGGSLLLEDCEIRDVTTAFPGAALALIGPTSVIVSDCTIRNANALPFIFNLPDPVPGGGIYAVDTGWLLLERTQISSSNAFLQGGLGYCRNSPVTMIDCTFANSTQSSEGGGFYLDACPTVEIRRSSFELAQADNGGALFVRDAGLLSLIGCRFERNGATGEGGALLIESSPFVIEDCEFDANHLTFDGIQPTSGGAVRSLASDGTVIGSTFRNERVNGKGGAWFQVGGLVEFRQCVFQDNEAALFGGALDLELGGEISLVECLLTGNGARFGGALAGSFTGKFRVLRCTLADNEGRGAGAAIYLDTAARAHVRDSILCCARQGDLVHCSRGHIDFAHSDIWNDDAQNLRAEFAGSCSSPIGESANLSADPRFCEPPGEEYSLEETSPCVGTGSDGGNMGWSTAGCPATIPVAIEGKTWGAIKARYRSGIR